MISEKFLALARHPLKFRMFMLQKLPSAFFSGVRLKHVDAEKAVVTVPYKWFSTNPFRSTYFACLAMAAEMSTGVLAIANVFESKPAVSMLVLGVKADFHKKATGITTFTCNDGAAISNAVEEAIRSKQAVTVQAVSYGLNNAGESVATFYLTWTFKAKS